jgi:hypothetical protein
MRIWEFVCCIFICYAAYTVKILLISVEKRRNETGVRNTNSGAGLGTIVTARTSVSMTPSAVKSADGANTGRSHPIMHANPVLTIHSSQITNGIRGLSTPV